MLILPFGKGCQEPCVLLLGGFDGLHLGHRQLLFEAKQSGLPVALTTVLGGKGKALFTAEERRELFARAGVGILCEIGLTGELRRLPAETFAREIFRLFRVRAVYCGEDFRFGKDALGTPELLLKIADCPVFVHKTVKYLAEESGRPRKFSATSCKELLKRGELTRLNACLYAAEEDFHGAYFIGGTVEHGRGVGRTYGFPTLNLGAPPGKLLPPDGVYGGMCATPSGSYPAVINIGSRPTFGVKERKIETYLDGFEGDLYGARVRVYPETFLRPVEKFPSAEALKEQLGRDIQTLRRQKARHI